MSRFVRNKLLNITMALVTAVVGMTILAVVATCPAGATTNEIDSLAATGGPTWSYTGFMDVVGRYSGNARDHSDISLLEAEFDATLNPTEHVALSAALALNPTTRSMDLTAAYATFDLRPNRPIGSWESQLMVGLFNPAFGIDCCSNNASCRKLSTAPIAVRLTHQSWADMGVQLQTSTSGLNATVFAVNGFEPAEEVQERVQSLIASVGDTVMHPPASAFGGRLGVVPMNGIEIGGSMATGYNDAGDNDMRMMGADFSIEWSFIAVKAEYISHSINRVVVRSDNSGFYIQPTVFYKRLFATYRYDSFKAEQFDRFTSNTIGCGYKIADPVELRIETVLADQDAADETSAQLFLEF